MIAPADDGEPTASNHRDSTLILECLRHFHKITRLPLAEFVQTIDSNRDINGAAQIGAMYILRIRQLANEIIRIAEKKDYSSGICIVLCRPLIESVVNLLYINVDFNVLAKEAFEHATQKSAGWQPKQVKFGSQHVEMKNLFLDMINRTDSMRELTNKWTTKSGNPRSWSDKSTYQKIESIEQKFSVKAWPLRTAFLQSYELSSEFIHGSLFSTIYGSNLDPINVLSGKVGATYPKTRDFDLIENAVTSAIYSLWSLVECMSTLLDDRRVAGEVREGIDLLKSWSSDVAWSSVAKP